MASTPTLLVSGERAAAIPTRCPVVGVGTSPRRYRGLGEFFAHIPVDVGAAFVVVPQVSPEGAGDPPDLGALDVLRAHTRLQVEEVHDTAPVVPNRVYLAPGGRSLCMEGGRLRLGSTGEAGRAGIDTFLESLARDQGELAVALILSGSGVAGALGARAVEEYGGIALVQAPDTGEQEDGLQHAALAHAPNRPALPLPDLARTLVRHVSVTAAVCQGPRAMSAGVTEIPPEIWSILRDATGRDLTGYKAGTVARRIARRMQELGIDALSEYLQRLRGDPNEPQALLQQLLISVTAFFRDDAVFGALEQRVLPRLVSEARGGELRVWVPGCATGEEAYSIAILAHEVVERLDVPVRVMVFATDLDARALEVARAGHYSGPTCAQVPPERLARWFTHADGGFTVTKQLRDSCLFSAHHVTGDPPFSRLDLISCRNVLIYLENELKRLLLPVFHYALRQRGVLLLGPSEGVGEHDELFAPLDAKLRLFERRDARPPQPPRFRFSVRGARQVAARRPAVSHPTQRGSIEQILLREFCPACAVVDAAGRVVNLSGPMGRFLELPQGPPATSLVDLAREELRLEVRTALHEAVRERRTIVHEGVTAELDGRSALLDVVVRPLPEVDGGERFLVVFQEREARAERVHELPDAGAEALERARAELRTAKAHLQTTVQELEISNAQLQIANEEQVTINEELQSANEELQTSQEELQSLNEELETVNGELSTKIEQLDRLNADLQNLLRSTQVAAVFLDADLEVKRFTPAATQLFRLEESDVGRRFTELAVQFADYDLAPEVAEVARTGKTRERHVRREGSSAWYLLRVLPYVGSHGTVDGVVVTFHDVTELKRAEEAISESARQQREILEAIPHMVWTAGFDGGRDHFSRQWLDYTGLTEKDLIGNGWVAVIHPDDREQAQSRWREACRRGEPFEVELRIRRADGAFRWFVSRAVPVRDDGGRVTRWFGSSTDIDDRKHMEEALQEAHRRKDEFLALLGHELRNPLAPLRNAVELLERRAGDEGGVARALPIMRRQIAQLSRLVDDLLDVERIKRAKIALRRERVDLATLARNVVDDHRPLFAEAKLRVELSLPPSVLVTMGDPARLAQVLGNLLHNAAKFTDPGGQVSVTLRREDGGRAAQLSVRDTGIGMEAPFLARVFEPFVQSHVARQRRRPGLGLGLALVKSLVELHGGAVRVSSEGLGKGSEVVVTLPVEHADTTSADELPASGATTRRRVLIIDDNEDAAIMLADLLAFEGHDVRVAGDGPAGVEAARAHRPDVVLCDLGLPGAMDGFAVARALRADPELSSAYLVALSGYATSEDQLRTRDAGFDRHVGKPASMDVLTQCLREATPHR